MNKLFVLDTNCFISAALIEGSVSAEALDRTILLGKLALSNTIVDELVEVLFRKKFDKYFLNDDERWKVLSNILSNAIFFSPTETITVCRDPKDNKFLELAVSAKAACIITGDKDLLVLHPFREVPI
ncbi:MAG: putative toxin-antitoxin system toxin component, PIN family, partial [Bacteroidetes bacterium HGW-Bacteroidetes-15]